MSTETVVCSTLYTFRIVPLLGICAILYKECTNRYELAKQNSGAYRNIYQRLVSIFSLISMALIVPSLTANIIMNIPTKPFCVIGWAFAAIFYCSSKVFLTLFQIARLQYLFMDTRIQTGYGYPKWLFIVLYSIGVLLLLYAIFYGLYVFTDTWTYQEFGGFHFCKGDDLEVRSVIMPAIGSIIFLIWDWTVISLYIVKMCQFYKMRNNMDKTVSNKIKFILYKITYLTFLIELWAVLFVIGAVLTQIFGPKRDRGPTYGTMISYLGYGFEHFWSAYVVYNMMDHNNNEYFRAVRRMDRLGMFCCCKSFVTVALSMDPDHKDEKNGYQILPGNDNLEMIDRAKTLPTHTKTSMVMSHVIAK